MIKKIIKEGITYKEIQTIIGHSAKIIYSALKCRANPERRERLCQTTI